jgi:F-type H+-transporting ATPase subunit b
VKTEGLQLSAVVNFALLAAALAYLLRKPARRFFGQRHERVKNAVEEAERLRAEAERLRLEYERKLADLERELAGILAEARRQGEEERTRVLERARKAAERIREQAERAAERARALILDRLKDEFLTRAAAQALESLKKRVTEEDHHALTHDFVRQLERDGAKGP